MKKSCSSIEKRLQWQRACLSQPPGGSGFLLTLGAGGFGGVSSQSRTSACVVVTEKKHVWRPNLNQTFPLKWSAM